MLKGNIEFLSTEHIFVLIVCVLQGSLLFNEVSAQVTVTSTLVVYMVGCITLIVKNILHEVLKISYILSNILENDRQQAISILNKLDQNK